MSINILIVLSVLNGEKTGYLLIIYKTVISFIYKHTEAKRFIILSNIFLCEWGQALEYAGCIASFVILWDVVLSS